MHFTQNEIEREIADAVPHGIRREIARDTGIYESIIYAMFNPDDERKSAQFTLLLIQAALDNIDPEIGERHWQKVCSLREASKPTSGENLCVAKETGNLSKEAADVVLAHCADKPLYEQLKEVCEAETQIMRTKQAILDKINSEKEAPDSGRLRIAKMNG